MQNQIQIWIKQRWRLPFVLLIPLVLLPLPVLNKTLQAKCGYIVIILSIYWISEVIPLPVTSLLPLIFFPMAGVLEPEEVAQSYFKDIIALFFGSLALAYAIECVNLHRRIALFVLNLVGTSTKWTMAGLMAVTGFLSMWINNAATASIMVPVVLAITEELEHHGRDYHDRKQAIKEASAAVNAGHDLTAIEAPNGGTRKDTFPIEEPKTEVVIEVKSGCCLPWGRRTAFNVEKPHAKKYKELKKGFLLGTAYSATIGGLASLVGSATNVFAKGFADSAYKDTDFRINFLNFLLFALPVAVIMLVLCWLWLQLLYNPKEFFQCRADPETREVQASLKAMLAKQYNDLGKPNWSECSVAVVFLIMILLWLTKQFGDTPGWEVMFRKGYISDSTVAVFCGVLPLLLPNSNPFKRDWKYVPIIQWKDLAKNLSWGVIFLFGAGLAIASAFTSSGLSESIAQALKFLDGISSTAVIIIVIVISGLFTQVTSNVSTVSIFLPVLDSVARSLEIHPGILILPCTLAVSLAFILPIATPPNAIVFSSGAIRVFDMIKTGIVMNIIGFLVIFLAAITWMPQLYGIDDEATRRFYGINTTTFPATRIG